MAKRTPSIRVYLEVGKTKTFAAALDWPGWCRSGRNEEAALQALCDYGPRYAAALKGTRLGFHAPKTLEAFEVVERQTGNATTDFGAIDLAVPQDKEPVDAAELKRWQSILRACWRTFDRMVEGAQGKTLSKGPRGGGRELQKIVEHVRDVNVAYLNNLGHKVTFGPEDDPAEVIAETRKAMLTTLTDAVNGDIPAKGPRGGQRWTPRYFMRRLAWHELDHAWEIEDRA